MLEYWNTGILGLRNLGIKKEEELATDLQRLLPISVQDRRSAVSLEGSFG